MYFKEGGVGTFLPLFFRLLEFWRHHQPQPSAAPQPSAPPSSLVATAFVDPSDPSKVYLTQPSQQDARVEPPVYATNYGEDEKYEPI
eukprot:jgi/Astpho2/2833/Aster-00993